MSQTWNPDTYEHHARFVSDHGRAVLELLNPQAGERILDLGCGDGALTAQLAAAGAEVVGVDSSAAMVEGAQARGLDARVMSGEALTFDREFDAVFSNAALHWMTDASAVIEGVARALKPGGRFVAEFGGHGNVAAITVALSAVLDPLGVPAIDKFYPSPDEYRALLEAGGFVIETMALIPRPTPLPTGMNGWLDTFSLGLFGQLPEPEREPAKERVVRLLSGALQDKAGIWTADYVRLRFAARLRS